MRVLLCSEDRASEEIRTLYIVKDILEISDESVQKAFRETITPLYDRKDITIKSVTLSDIMGEPMDLNTCNKKALRLLQTAEFGNTVGDWIETNNPELGEHFAPSYQPIKKFRRTDLNNAMNLAARLRSRISGFPGKGELYIYPTAPMVAPLKGSLDNPESVADFYNRTMAVTSFAGVGRIPELSLPLATIDGAPIGLSLSGAVYQDEFVLKAAKKLF